MVELIQELLLTNNCVIIPNFGAFIGNYNPAEIRLQQNTILPPNKIIAFNRSLQNNDGLLINKASHHFSITYNEAEIYVADFVKQYNDSLVNHRSLILKDIGRLILDNENNIQFQPYYIKNYWLNSFGLPEMSLQPIQRLKDTESVIKETYQRILHPELMEDVVTPKYTSTKTGYWFTAILAIVFIASSLTWNIYKINTYQNESSMIPSFEKETIQPPVKKVETVVQPAIPAVAVNEEVKEMQPAETKLSDLSLDNTYVIVGAFFTIARAETLRTEIEKKGYVVNIIKDDTEKLFHTAIQLDNKEAETALVKIKTDINPHAWVYCVKCRL